MSSKENTIIEEVFNTFFGPAVETLEKEVEKQKELDWFTTKADQFYRQLESREAINPSHLKHYMDSLVDYFEKQGGHVNEVEEINGVVTLILDKENEIVDAVPGTLEEAVGFISRNANLNGQNVCIRSFLSEEAMNTYLIQSSHSTKEVRNKLNKAFTLLRKQEEFTL